jgi:hypothetical protein
MSVYYHVAKKEQILDGIVDLVFSEIEVPSPGGDGRSEMRRRAISARAVLSRHPGPSGCCRPAPSQDPPRFDTTTP